jgi:glutamine---fructose-6-phosphate transaminase (isomerizing)
VTEPFVPELRASRPWVMEEMIASQPALIEAMDRPAIRDAAARIAEGVITAVEAGAPVIVSGCGTSEHAAMAVAAQLRLALAAAGRSGATVSTRQAFEAWLEPQAGGLHLAISHEGETAATVAAMGSAAAAGARVMAITAMPKSRTAALADVSLVTPQHDRSWCHTVGYLSPIVAGAVIAGEISRKPPSLVGLAATARAALGLRESAEGMGARLAGVESLLVVGSGLDAIAASELALKVREGARLAATAYPLETVLHGHLAAAERADGLAVVLADPAHGRVRLARARQVLAAAREIGMASAALVASDMADELTAGGLASAGSVALPPVESELGAAGVLVASAIGLQLLTVGLAGARDTNPDRIRREQEPYARAAAVAESGGLTS